MAARFNGRVWTRYSGDSDDDDAEAEPGVFPDAEGETTDTSRMLDVDGEVFALRPDKHGGTHYTWLSGPNPGYGFTLSPTSDTSVDEHRENIHDFLSQIDPATGYVEDD